MADSQVKLGYAGTYHPVDLPPVTPPKGKTIWIIEFGMSSDAAVLSARGMEEAAKLAGWNTKVIDGKYDPSVWLQGIRSAIASKADGIWLYAFDCSPVKAGMQEAKAASIPVVITQGIDCGTGDNALATHVTGYAAAAKNGTVSATPTDLLGWASALGAITAWWTIKATDQHAKAIVVNETDLKVTSFQGDAYKSTLAKCGTCRVVDEVDFTGAELGAALQQKVAQALLSHPETNVVYTEYDTMVTSGVAAAVRASGRKDIRIIGGEGYAANVNLVRDGTQAVGYGYDAELEGWNAAYEFSRLFTGAKPLSNEGFGLQLFDATHNLPAAGKAFSAGDEYRNAVRRSWGISG